MGKKAREDRYRDYRAIVEGQSGLLCRFHVDGRIIFVNRAYAELRDCSEEQLLGSSLWEHMDAEHALVVRRRLVHLNRASPQTVFDEESVVRGEQVRWILWAASVVDFDAEGRAATIQATGVDITERKQAELDLVESEARLRLALEAAHAGVWSMDLEHGWSRCSPELAILYGYSPEMFPSYERWIARVHPDDRERLQGGLDRYINSESVSFQGEFRIVHPEKGVRWMLDMARAERDANGKALRLYGVTMDITERKRGEDALRESERRFRYLADAVPTLVWAASENGELSYVNRSWINYTGYDLEQCRELGWEGILHPEDQQTIGPLWGSTLPEIDSREGEARIRRADGEYRWHYFKMVRLDVEESGASGWHGASLDVHEHRKIEQAMRDSEGLFHMIADMAPIMLWITEVDGKCSFLSKGWYDFTGIAPDRAIGWGWTEAIHPDDRAETKALFLSATHERSEYERDYRMRRFDGEYRWVFDRGRSRFSPTGEFLGFIGSIVDIHERTEAEARLRESEERFRTLADNMSQLSWMADQNGRLVWFNRRWYEFTGASEKRSVNWGWVKYLHPDHRHSVIRRIQHSWDTGEQWEDTFPLRDRHGKYHWFLSRALPIRDEEGTITRWFGTHTDVTAQWEAEEALRIANQRKNEFLATLAHELRNPLAPLRNGLEIMQLAALDPEVINKARDMMERQLEHMVRLIDDLLDLSRISRGKIRLDQRLVDLTEVISQAVEISRPRIEAQALDFYLKLPDEKCCVLADPTRLSQVFANLLNNSAKFTQRGGAIWMTVEIVEGKARVCVKDNGIGMPRELVPEVFEMFAQGERSLDTAQGGLGVGLSLVKGLVEMHGGCVQAYSGGPGLGSEFTVTLPLADVGPPEEAKQPEPVMSVPPEHHRVLVVDDNSDSALSMATMLELLGNETRTANDGVEALAAAADFRPDIVLLDIGMPKLNGYEVAKRLRKEEWGKDLLLVAVTGWGQDEDQRRSRDAGFDLHLVKPATLEDIQELLHGGKPKPRT